MLSRVAERMYWFGRYMERVEDTALLVRVNNNLMLDLPKVKHIWHSLLSITGEEQQYANRYQLINEQNVVKFLLAGEGSSIRESVRFARENARTTREIMPRDAWEKVNKLHHYLKNNLDKGLTRNGRDQFLGDVIGYCHELTGYLHGCMSSSEPYQFIRLGRHLERADMTSRILDVGVFSLTSADIPELQEHENLLWTNVLRSLSGYQAYRLHVNDRINGEDVAAFLVRDTHFPRAITHCLDEAVKCCESLPREDLPLRAVTKLQRMLHQSNVITMFGEKTLHDLIDNIQLELAHIHDEVVTNWFDYDFDASMFERTIFEKPAPGLASRA
ncbi:MAG: alpha-E domain-containing protein [Proteobacteria bacterium]|nr:alpha-E domain-containing protein [Pseudomonadota bacterium]